MVSIFPSKFLFKFKHRYKRSEKYNLYGLDDVRWSEDYLEQVGMWEDNDQDCKATILFKPSLFTSNYK